MLKNYLFRAIRRLKNDRLFTLLNIVGLTVGVSAFILLTLYVRFDMSYDDWHEDVDQVHVVANMAKTHEGPSPKELTSLKGTALFRDQVPELSMMTQVGYVNSGNLVDIGSQRLYQEQILEADNKFLEMLTYEFIEGKVNLDLPGQAALTESLAAQYFGETSAIGKVIEIESRGKFEVMAIVKDPPANTHIPFKMLISNYEYMQNILPKYEGPNQWGRIGLSLVKIPAGADIQAITDKMNAVRESDFSYFKAYKDEEGNTINPYYLVPFRDAHLKSGFTRSITPVNDIQYIYLFFTIGALILFIACFNYINLVTARSIKKSKEIGLRKVIGAFRSQIIGQQMTEAFLFTFISVILAFALSERLLPWYNQLVGLELELSYQSTDFLLFVVGLSVVVSLCAGYYPAFKLSKFKPIEALRGGKQPKAKSGLRRSLVFFQFFVAQGLIITTIIIQFQLNYLQTKSLGYDREHVLFIDTHGELEDKTELFKSQLSAFPGVKSFAFSDEIIRWNSISFLQLKDIKGFEDSEENFVAESFNVGTNFIETMGMTIKEGLSFAEVETTTEPVMLINEITAQKLGWDDPLGKDFNLWGQTYKVVGVVANFHNESLKSELMPALMLHDPSSSSFASVRVHPQQLQATLAQIEAVWDDMVPERPFAYQFYDEYYDALYKKEMQMGNVFNVFSVIAVLISVLGLIGLTTFSAEQKLKEFSIRKVLGAKGINLVYLLSREFFILLVLAFVVVSPIIYYVMDDWIGDFAYRVDIDVFVFGLAIGLTLLIAMGATISQAMKVATANPVDYLRNE